MCDDHIKPIKSINSIKANNLQSTSGEPCAVVSFADLIHSCLLDRHKQFQQNPA